MNSAWHITQILSGVTLTVGNFTAGGLVVDGVTKDGNGTLTLSEVGGDDFSGGVIVNNGTLILDNTNSAISGGVNINGGTLQIGTEQCLAARLPTMARWPSPAITRNLASAQSTLRRTALSVCASF